MVKGEMVGRTDRRTNTSSLDQTPAWMKPGIPLTISEGRTDLEVVGESHYQENLWVLVGGRSKVKIRREILAILVPEPTNPYDKNAVAVWIHFRKVGYLSRDNAKLIAPGLHEFSARVRTAVAMRGAIVGGGYDGPRLLSLGVFLRYNPVDFGLKAAKGWDGPVATERWDSRLSDDPTVAAAQVRDALASESDLIVRHEMYNRLESLLYRARETKPDALAAYDAAVRAHDAEMDLIVPQLKRKFGHIPALETYKQAAIRHQKVKDIAGALWWAKRGVSLYGDRGIEADVAYLRNKVADYERKLAPGAE